MPYFQLCLYLQHSTYLFIIIFTVCNWSVFDVAIWLKLQSVQQDIINDFKEQDVDGKALRDITEDDLKGEEFPHVKTFGKRKDVMRKIRELLTKDEFSNTETQSYSPNGYLDGNNSNVASKTKSQGDSNGCSDPNNLLVDQEIQHTENTQDSKVQHLDDNEQSQVENTNTPDMHVCETTEPERVPEIGSEECETREIKETKQNKTSATEGMTDCTVESSHEIPLNESLKDGSDGSPENSHSVDEQPLSYCFPSPTKFKGGDLALGQSYQHMSKLSAARRKVTDLINPVESFVRVDLGDDKNLVLFTENVMKVICACLNDRTNARIYVGVGDDCTIHGTVLARDFSSYHKIIGKMIYRCFHKDVRDTVHQCVRHPKFVDVVTAEACQDKLYVLEIDVIPSADLCRNKLFPVRLPNKEKSSEEQIFLEKEALFKFQNEDVICLSGEKKHQLSEKIEAQNGLRKYHENLHLKKQEQEKEDMFGMKQKLLELLGLDTGKYVDLYPILVMNQPSENMDQNYITENLAFIANMELKAVFDFDANGTIQTCVENELNKLVKIIPTTDEFDQHSTHNQNNPERLAAFQDELLSSKLPHWIFCNGFELGGGKFPKLSKLKWHKEKKESFKECVSFFKKQIPQGRAVIIFAILSHEPSMMTDAIQEFMSAFPEQWVFICEDKNLVQPHFEELTRRSVEEKDTLQKRSIIDVPFKKVQAIIQKATGFMQVSASTLPCSDGKFIQLNDKMKHELTDLEILSSTECDQLADMPQDSRKQMEIEEENYFYKGGEVSWRNFWFNKHVLQRSKHKSICQEVYKTAQSDTVGDSYLGRLTLYHQPGAGGTTMAKHVLWDCRKAFRCAIVRNKTEQTASQINTLRSYKDVRPMPVLLLLDNVEEEPATNLLAELELQAKQTVRSMEHTERPKHFCLVLVCLRRSKMPIKSTDGYRTLLKHELLPNELTWFQRKFNDLEQRFGEKDIQNSNQINPKLLISFNIMKQNFDQSYIRRMTKDMVNEIDRELEKKLLKYIALLNAFDLDFKEVPCAAFDNMMVKIPWQSGPRRGRGAAARCWEANLSSEFRVLINETSTASFTSIKAMRITNPLLSKEILRVLQTSSETTSDTISSFMLEFLNCKEVFSVTCHAKEGLLKIVKDLMKRRGRLPSGTPESKFAPLIQHIVDKETVECGLEVLEKAFTLTTDPYVAQQIARLCMHAQKWDVAIKFADEAIRMKQESSFLWDTYGRIYQNQLLDKYYQFSTTPDKKLDMEEVLEVTEIAMKGAEIFRQVQRCSEQESSSLPTNNAGYFGELEITECLLHCLRTAKCFKNITELKQCLVEDEYYPDALKKMVEEVGDKGHLLEKLKTIKQCTEEAMNKLEDERMQLHGETIDEYRENSIQQRNRKMELVQKNLDFYLGEQAEKLPSNIDPLSDEACRRRRRRINTLGGTSSRSIFDLKLQLDGQHKLIEIRKLCLANIDTQYATAMDYQVAIAASISLTTIDPKYVHKYIQFSEILRLSQMLYEKRNIGEGMIFLEPYLFYVLFNWPKKTAASLTTPKQLQQVLTNWKDAYYLKWPKQSDGNKPNKQKDKTIFFFGYGSEMASVVSYHEIKAFQRGEIFWREPSVVRKLRRFEGVLLDYGEYVSVHVKHASGHPIEIPTSFPIRDRKRWNKRVYFVIGFSWKGPKAFDISLNDPTEDVDFMVMDHKVHFSGQELKNEKPVITQANIITKLTELNQKLEHIQELKAHKKRGSRLTRDQVSDYESNLVNLDW